MEDLFESKFTVSGNSYSINVVNSKIKKVINLEIIIESASECLISVYTDYSHLQLQSCMGFIISKMLEEVIFISETNEKISGLIVSKQGDCSLYSNVDKSIFSKDFMELSSEKLLAAVALSVADSSEK